MPGAYAHYRFGVEMLAQLPGDIRAVTDRFRQLYDMGLHGPDIFFYYNPVVKTRVGSYGSRFHMQTGREFFSRVCRGLRLEPSEAGTAYLYGVLCHYALDSVCHPFIKAKAAEGVAGHTQIETEFDRFLLQGDGKQPRELRSRSSHIRLSAGECAVAAKFYPPASAAQIRDAVRNMAFFDRLLSTPEGLGRSALHKGITLFARDKEGMLMRTEPDPRCAFLNGELSGLYRQARELFPRLLEQLSAHLTYNAALGPEFAADFG